MIKCLSTNCTFNNSGVCSASVIHIEGFDADITPETYCKTFIEADDSYKVTSSVDESDTSSKCIICSACNCIYNFKGSCKSSSVQINALNNTCETFKKRYFNSYEY
ncbi:DUF1540 domain-containing protein [Paraclostridium ghonii]|uniref:DUF1540 domain-containing protein n=1 Tax=Paraclostridium ghonii TaxID=29358 RepID=UPI00202CCD4D|nr:DUF1540 domain-containing protein [Paeniclostridium ghonii]MCM0168104.1 DUF1540 domain-containing protein [Paeniclostridium ghonii]